MSEEPEVATNEHLQDTEDTVDLNVEDMADSPSADHIVDFPSADHIVDSSSGDQIVESSSADPIAESSSADPIVESSSADPIVDSSSADPIVDYTSADPIVDSSSSDPIVDSSSADPIVDSSSADPMIECSSADPMVESSHAGLIDWKNLRSDAGLSDAARKRVFAFAASNNKSTYRKVEEAIAVIGTSDTGASVTAIITWIINNYSTLDPSKLKVNVKRAVLKGLKVGRLVRTKASKKALGVAGSFTFPAQRIKLKAVRLDGKRYLFPILQPVSSSTKSDTKQVTGDAKQETGDAKQETGDAKLETEDVGTGEGLPQVVDAIAKKRKSMDASKASPKRVVKKNRTKSAISEISN